MDVINDFDFPEGNRLLRFALPAARKIAALKKRLRKSGVPAIYVNDNFGRWQSDFKKQVERCVSDDSPGAEVARLLIPAQDDYFVLKPKHSGFFSTSLDVLLSYLGARKLILTGFAADICVLFTANDAYMRDYDLIVPSDCIAAETAAARRYASQQDEAISQSRHPSVCPHQRPVNIDPPGNWRAARPGHPDRAKRALVIRPHRPLPPPHSRRIQRVR